MRTVSVRQRRNALVRRHHLAGDAAGPEEVTRALVALHATDPASVHLSVLARSRATTLADVGEAMYARRSLVRWMAMRRTLFVFDRAEVPVVQAAVSTPLAARLRRQLVSRFARNGSEPPIDGDVGVWLGELELAVEEALGARGAATGAQLAGDVPGLRTAITEPVTSGQPPKVTSPLLTLMSAEGRIVRSTPTGAWTSRHHRWEPVGTWWPEGLPGVDAAQAEATLARRWLAAFGPATAADLQWWTGWTKATTLRALAALRVEEVDLHGEVGVELPAGDDHDPVDTLDQDPVAALLPALDPTPMGWKRRDWYLGVDPGQIFDRAGNIGPTVWWDGEIVGSWAVTGEGIRTALLADRGREARAAVEEEACRWAGRLEGAVVVPAARTPLERALTDA